jgi:hypothetical protein
MTDPPRPYGSTAFVYRTAGWQGPLPVGSQAKPLDKDPVPAGFTGGKHGDVWPDDDQLTEWVKTFGRYNIGLRLPRDTVGIDLDIWKGDSFRETAEAITDTHGKLPRTWMSTSRTDRSGIRLFRLPTKVKENDFSGVLKHPDGSDRTAGEVIRHGHRFAVVWPSIHPDTGETYRWVDQTTGEISNRVPRPSELAELLPEWIDHLRGDCSCFVLKIRMSGSKDPVAETFDRWHGKLTSGTYSRHDAALGGSMALVAFKYRNWPGASEYLQKLESAFLSALSADRSRTDKEARDEWERMLEGAETKAPMSTIPQWEPPRTTAGKQKEATKPEGRRILLTSAADIAPLPIRWL